MDTRHSHRFYLFFIVISLVLLAYGRAATAWVRYQGPPHSTPAAYMPGPVPATWHGNRTPRWTAHPQRPWPGRTALPGIARQPQTPAAKSGSAANTGPDSERGAATVDLPGSQAAPQQSAEQKKLAFIETLLPLVVAENERLDNTRRRVLRLLAMNSDPGMAVSESDADWLRRLATSYRIDDDPLADATAATALKHKVDIIPAGLAIAQAANESAWGNSRFAREGNNLFGVWTYDPAKGIKPKNRAAGKTHLVRVYDDLGESVRSYMHNLNSHPAYQALRAERARLRAAGKPLDASVLAGGLVKYSELGEEYVRRIRAMIRDNKLERLDHARLAAV